MKITEYIKRHPEGFSLDFESLNPLVDDKGFIVSITDNKLSNLDDADDVFKRLCMLGTALSISPDKLVIGGWFDGVNYFLDLSAIVSSKLEALVLKRLFNQRAVFNCETLEAE